jgi:hypothetical protein
VKEAFERHRGVHLVEPVQESGEKTCTRLKNFENYLLLNFFVASAADDFEDYNGTVDSDLADTVTSMRVSDCCKFFSNVTSHGLRFRNLKTLTCVRLCNDCSTSLSTKIKTREIEIKTLSLSLRNRFSPDSLYQILSSLTIAGSIHSLEIKSSALDHPKWIDFSFPKLESLMLYDTGIDAKDFSSEILPVLTRSPHLRRLCVNASEFLASHHPLDLQMLPSLEEVDFSSNGSIGSLEGLVKVLTNPSCSLKLLDVSKNIMEPDLVDTLLSALGVNNSVTCINMSYCDVSLQSAFALLKVLVENRGVGMTTTINLSGNFDIAADGGRELLDLLSDAISGQARSRKRKLGSDECQAYIPGLPLVRVMLCDDQCGGADPSLMSMSMKKTASGRLGFDKKVAMFTVYSNDIEIAFIPRSAPSNPSFHGDSYLSAIDTASTKVVIV